MTYGTQNSVWPEICALLKRCVSATYDFRRNQSRCCGLTEAKSQVSLLQRLAKKATHKNKKLGFVACKASIAGYISAVARGSAP